MNITKPYLLGVLHDASRRRTTYRISRKLREFVEFVANCIRQLGGSAWVYKEGKDREVYVVEFSQSFEDVFVGTLKDKADYTRGYFDTEGGIAKQSQVRYYIYFARKDYQD